MAQKTLKLRDEDIAAITRMVYGEAAGADYDTMKMIAQTVANRLRSGRSKEFGGNVTSVLKKGYYAVSNSNQPYKQALAGQFKDTASQKAWAQAIKSVSDVFTKQDYGNAMFYFTPEEIARQQGKFNFNAVVSTGDIGNYKTFGYRLPVSHYQKGQ